MKIFTTKQELDTYLAALRETGNKVALVPTMGALHEGHLSLIKEAKEAADVVVCSIFVNPTQFNDPEDLAKYPQPLDEDLHALKLANCDVVFTPTVLEMYPQNEPKWFIDLGELDQVWEGEKRPGHFQGVTQIVYKLFKLVEPDVALFGQKDFQQVMVIQRMVELKALPVTIKICPTVRDANGLALSSRNQRLTPAGKSQALALYKALNHIKNNIQYSSVAQTKEEAVGILHKAGVTDIEYLAICRSSTLEEIDTLSGEEHVVVLLVAWVDGVRLIDNMILR